MKTLLLVLDLVGTFVFALSGASAGVRRRLDVFGVLVLSFVAGNFGGKADTVLMRILDITVSFPYFILVIAIVAVVAWFVSTRVPRTGSGGFTSRGCASRA